MAETIVDAIARAIGDPGSIVSRWPEEPVTRWATRAVMTLLEMPTTADIGDQLTVGSPATRLLMDNAQLRATQEVLLQDAWMWRNRALDLGWKLGVDANV